MENDDTANATKESSDISVEIDALKSEIESLKTSHAADLEKLAAENRRLKDKLVEYITIPQEKMPVDEKPKGLSLVDDWIAGKIE